MKKTMDWGKLDKKGRSIVLSFLQAAFLCASNDLEEDFFMEMAHETWKWMEKDPEASYGFWQAAIAHEIKD